MKIWFTALALLAPGSFGQTVLQSGEGIFVISVSGGLGVGFRGSCLTTKANGEAVITKLEGAVLANFIGQEYRVAGTAVYLTVQNQTAGKEPEVRVDANGNTVLDKKSPGALGGHFLEVSLSKNGTTIKTQRTDAPYGVISLRSDPPATSATPILTELRVEGDVKFAMVTYTNETGDSEQQLLPIPFSKQFYPREGSIVGLLAQKTRVTRLDSSSLREASLILDDGRGGSLHVAIRVNGAVLAESQTSEPFGVASVSTRIP